MKIENCLATPDLAKPGKIKNYRLVLVFAMVVILFSIFYSLLSVPPAHAATINAPANFLTMNSGLVGHWSFDAKDMVNNVKDTSGQNNHGALKFGTLGNKATSTMVTAGKLGQGLKFDGRDDYVTATPLSSISKDGVFSVSLWLKADYIIAAGDFRPLFSHNLSSSDVFVIAQSSSSIRTGIYNGSTYTVKKYATFTDTKNWHNVIVTYDGTTLNLYLDTVNATDVGNPSAGTATGFIIGGSADLNKFFPGSLDDVRIYNRALSAGEVKQLYNLGATKINTVSATTGGDTLKTGLVGYWTFDAKNMQSKVTDTSGQNNHGALQFGALGNKATSSMLTTGKLGQGLKFDGVDDYVNLPVLPTIIAPYSVSFWFNPKELNRNQYIVALQGANPYPKFGFFSSGNRLLAYAGDEKYRYGSKTFTSADLNKWWHVIFVVTDGTSLTNWKVYLNGVNNTGNAGGNTGTYYEPSLYGKIGADASSVYAFNGTLDDVRIYNRALSAAEITQLYNLGATKINTVSATGGGDTLKTGLVGYWSFDAKNLQTSVKDTSGLNNNGSLKFGTLGNISTTSMVTAGKMGQALKFDGVDDYVDIDKNVSLQGKAQATISAWVKLKASPPSTLNTIYSETTSTYYSRCTLGIDSGGKVDFIIRDSNADPSGTRFDVYSNTVLKANIWYYITAVFDSVADSHKIYINGVLGNTDTTARSAFGTSVTTNIEIGNLDVNSYYFTGSLDDVRVYNRALSAAEVRQLYNLGR